jgi:hypothetical protein
MGRSSNDNEPEKKGVADGGEASTLDTLMTAANEQVEIMKGAVNQKVAMANRKLSVVAAEFAEKAAEARAELVERATEARALAVETRDQALGTIGSVVPLPSAVKPRDYGPN